MKHWDLITFWVVAAILFALGFITCTMLVAGTAHAVDAACVNPVAADPAQILNGTNGLKLCTPQVDVNGEPLAPGELERCTIYADGAPYASIATTTPGSYWVIAPPSSGPKRRAVHATCEGQGGVSAPTATYDALMRRAQPGKPVVLP